MANFLLLYSGSDHMALPESKRVATMQEWGAWFGKIGSDLVDGGNPFTSTAKSIASDGSVSNGPAGTMATGYSIVKADSLDAAVELARGCPILRGGGQISVYETFSAM